ncbi:DNA polymerase III subunit delta [Pseudohongiella spirulinae]|uniref:DNA polymerase III subunit delta n=1 Tax=Pseudohongiella spirulinae TaxID=1249552 RepID=A0A0S2KFB9_9GAMM|nr:DNA polymerase III subunit delta [Pseudohongiella spirulinae]ALO46798.1 DNA polymerase III subunit delta [Pseudohongiella spirulinae]
MKVYADQFNRHLQGELHNAYWICGDEPLQLRELTDALRKKSRSNGYTEREVYEVDRQFDWRTLHAASSSMSLFADKKLIELRLRQGKLDEPARKQLTEYLLSPATDTLLLMISPKLDSAATKTQWFKKIEQNIVLVQVYAVETDKLNAWISRRLANFNLRADADALQLLADRIEGNMLAADQEIEKLSLLYGKDRQLGIQDIARSVADNSRFNVFSLIDACLAGDPVKAVHTLQRMREEGAEALMIVAMLAREIRLLMSMALQIEKGTSLAAAVQSARVWKNRQSLVNRTLQRHSSDSFQSMLSQLRDVDMAVKGLGSQSPWIILEQLICHLSGRALKFQSAQASQ